MHTEIFSNIDLLIEMAGSTLDVQDIESDLIQVNKDIQDKIVGVLSLIDEKIDINNNVNDNLPYQSLMVA